MARAPDLRVEQAMELYAKGMKLIEIAATLKVPEGTVRSWKNRYDWDATLHKKKCNVDKKERRSARQQKCRRAWRNRAAGK